MNEKFARFDIFNKDETTLLHSVQIPINLINEAYMLYAIDTFNVVKIYDNENVLRINSKLLNTINQTL